MSRAFYRWILGILCTILMVPFVGYVWTGWYSRYLQDDYCYAAFLRGDNFFATQWHSYFNIGAYSANRYSLTIMMGISEAMGRFTVAFLPGLAVVLWVLGFMALLRQMNLRGWLRLETLECFALSLAIVDLAIYQAPNRVQILYWRAGMLPYLAPLITQNFLGAGIIQASRMRKPTIVGLMGLLLLAFLAAGFSETGAAFQVGILGITFIAALIMNWKKKPSGKQFLIPLGVALLGTLLGGLALVLSPVNAQRITNIYTETQSIAGILSLSSAGVVAYIQNLLYRVTLPTFFAFFLFMACGWIYAIRQKRSTCLGFRKVILILIGIQVIHLILIFITLVPSAFAMSSYPADRSLLSARFTSILMTAFSGLFIGAYLAENIHKRLLRRIILPFLAGTLVLGVGLLFLAEPTLTIEPAYPDMRAYVLTHIPAILLILIAGLILGWLCVYAYELRPDSGWARSLPAMLILLSAIMHLGVASESIYAWIPDYRFRSQMWDMRDGQIRDLASQGSDEIEVRALDSLDGIAELQGNAGHWVNNCAAYYYGVDSIWAVEPVLNPSGVK